MRKQIKLTESKILEAIEEVLTDYENGSEDETPSWYKEFSKTKYARKPEETPDFNDNIYDFNNGRYAMLSQSDDDFDKALGQTQRGTQRATRNEVERYVDSLFEKKVDTIVNETINSFLAKH